MRIRLSGAWYPNWRDFSFQKEPWRGIDARDSGAAVASVLISGVGNLTEILLLPVLRLRGACVARRSPHQRNGRNRLGKESKTGVIQHGSNNGDYLFVFHSPLHHDVDEENGIWLSGSLASLRFSGLQIKEGNARVMYNIAVNAIKLNIGA